MNLCLKNMTKYNQEIEAQMCLFFSSLNEKEKRHYAAQEATKLGYGGKIYISNLLGISEARIRRGEADLKNKELYAQIPLNKQRRQGSGLSLSSLCF